ncbi:MAG: dethiobiotin synthase [Verrucomicrobiota bacterium]
MGKIIFITGTDTGAGKTVLTALLLGYLRGRGRAALAVKPFCSGDRADVALLQQFQPGTLTEDEVNPWFFRQPVAPLVALRKAGKDVRLQAVLAHIHAVAKGCECLLVEGSGGLMVPLGEGYTVLDLINRLQCPVLLAAQNRLGCINHICLSLSVLKSVAGADGAVVLMGTKIPDVSTRTNRQLIAEKSGKFPVFTLPYLGDANSDKEKVVKGTKRCCKTLSLLCAKSLDLRA